MHCIECRKPSRYVYQPYWKSFLCESCIDNQVCDWCAQFGGCAPVDGRVACRDCRRHIVDTDEEIEELKSEALFIISQHIGPNNLHLIPVFLKKEGKDGAPTENLGAAYRSKDLTVLFLESGIPDAYALAILCHEFGHAMLFRNHETLEIRATAGSHELIDEEGFCQVLFAVALQTRRDPVARWQSFILPGSKDPIYGGGFRKMWKLALEVGSVASLLEALSGDPVAFRGPRLEAVVDDSLDDEDLVGVAEIGSGDPTKGPLRGTALRVEDAPKDIPRGPRLRGTALAVAREHEREEAEIKKGVLRGQGLAAARVKEVEKEHLPDSLSDGTESHAESETRLRGKDIK